MKKLNARFVEKTVAAIYRFYPRSIIKGIMLTGSHATGEACPDSDIDVLLLSNLSNRQTMETLTFKGHTYQFIIAPSNKIYELVYKDYMTAHFVFLSLFEKGIILYDEDGKLGKVRSVVLSSKPWSLKDHDILTLRASVTSALETLRKSKNPQSGLCTASEAIIMTARLICGRKSYSGKHLDKILSTYPREAGALRQALEQYLCDGNGQAFAAGLETLLRTYGGLLNNHTNGYVLSAPPSTRHLLAFLPGALPSDKSIIRNVCTIVRKTSDFMPTIFYVGQGQFMEHGIYISFHSIPQGTISQKCCEYWKTPRKTKSFLPRSMASHIPIQVVFMKGYIVAVSYCMTSWRVSWPFCPICLYDTGKRNMKATSCCWPIVLHIITSVMSSPTENKSVFDRCLEPPDARGTGCQRHVFRPPTFSA